MISNARRHLLTAVAAAALTLSPLALTGCSDSNGGGEGGGGSGGNFQISDSARIEIEPNTNRLVFEEAGLEVGQDVARNVRVINTGTAKLIVSAVTLDYQTPEGGDDGGVPAFQLEELPFSLPSDVFPLNGADFPQGVQLRIIYTRPADDIPRTASLTISSNDPTARELTIELATETGAPNLSTDQDIVDFTVVPAGETSEKELRLLNIGTRVLNVSGFKIERDIRFGVEGDNFSIGGGPDSDLIVDLPEAIVIPSGESRPVKITFSSDVATPAEGTLRIFSDDPDSGSEGYTVELVANKSGPCILVEPFKVEFGGKVVGTVAEIDVDVTSCGTEPLVVSSISMKDGSSPDFSLKYDKIASGEPSPATPLSIPVNEVATLTVVFLADEVNEKDLDNVPIPDVGTLVIESNAFTNMVEVPVSGAGAEAECPIPVIRVEEGEEVIPQTVLHLDGTQSYAPFGSVTKYNWMILEAPEGNTEKLVPTPSDPQPVFAANLVGVYKFGLDVWDDSNTKSGQPDCPTAEFTVVVQPDQAIHVELTWQTPGDEDETDVGEGAGSDLDLHFTHPNATGPDLDADGAPDPWFDEDWDCFWHNPEPNWGTFTPGAGDDPKLDRDDVDGGGPENLNLEAPEDGAIYKIAAHYWDDHGFGPALATVRVFYYAEEIFTQTDVELEERDLWCVGYVNWPDPVVTPCVEGTEAHIVPDYVNPFFFQP